MAGVEVLWAILVWRQLGFPLVNSTSLVLPVNAQMLISTVDVFYNVFVSGGIYYYVLLLPISVDSI